MKSVSAYALERQVEIAGKVMIADGFFSRLKGLLGREGLLPGEGLWIIPCNSVHTFGMRFPIDVVFLDRDGKVLDWRENMGAGRMARVGRAHSVIELPSGWLKLVGIAKGEHWVMEPEKS